MNKQKKLLLSLVFRNRIKSQTPLFFINKYWLIATLSIFLLGQIMPSVLNMHRLSYQIKAQELASVNVLQQVNAGGGNVQRTEFAPTRFELSMDSLGLAEVDALSPTLKTQFQANEFIGKIIDGGTATVTLNILPITRENVPALYLAVDDVINSVTQLVEEVSGLADELLNFSPGILQVNGLDEVFTALNALNNLEAALNSLTAYEQEVSVDPDNLNGILIVEYADGLGQHIESLINDVVYKLLYDLSNALSNLEITLIDGGINTGNIVALVQSLDNLPLLRGLLAPLLGDGILGQIVDILGGLLGPIIDLLLRPLLGPAVEQVVALLEDVVNGLLATIGTLVGSITSLADTLTTDVLEITDGLIALQLIGGVAVSLNTIHVDETVKGIVDVRALAVDEPVVDVALFTTQGAVVPIDFGDFVETLAFISVPEVLAFEATEISGKVLNIPRENPNWTIMVEDTRRLERYFRVTARVAQPLTSEYGTHHLPNALRFITSGGESKPITNTPVEVFSRDTGENNEVTINWPENQGPMIVVDTKEVHATGYSTTITWTLEDAP